MNIFDIGDHIVFRENCKDPPRCGVIKGIIYGTIETEYVIEIPHINDIGRDCITGYEKEINFPRTRLKVAQEKELDKEKKQ